MYTCICACYISNSFLHSTDVQDIYGKFAKTSGPSVTNVMGIETDTVRCLECYSWPIEETRDFFHRTRTSGWPNSELLMRCQNAACYLVPKWDQREVDSDPDEWRYSFSMAEKILVRSFTNQQGRLFVCGKYLLKHAIHPQLERQLPHSNAKSIISSYHIKTAVFWLSETSDLKDADLITNVARLFRYLHDTIENGNGLPSFFINTCCLFSCVNHRQQQVLLSVIKHVIHNKLVYLSEYARQIGEGKSRYLDIADEYAFDDIHVNTLTNYFREISSDGSSDIYTDVCKVNIYTTRVLQMLAANNYNRDDIMTLIHILMSLGSMADMCVRLLLHLLYFREGNWQKLLTLSDSFPCEDSYRLPNAIDAFEATDNCCTEEFFEMYIRSRPISDKVEVPCSLVGSLMPVVIQHFMKHQFQYWNDSFEKNTSNRSSTFLRRPLRIDLNALWIYSMVNTCNAVV